VTIKLAIKLAIELPIRSAIVLGGGGEEIFHGFSRAGEIVLFVESVAQRQRCRLAARIDLHRRAVR
jgi:hypothetical protein